jgi:superfamily II DNA or RNA helicase
VPLSGATLRAARARIAEVVDVGAPELVPSALGEIHLRDDQRRAVARVARALHRDHGCLLADEVGRGKTYVALAIARAWRHPLVVIPASLRDTWTDAMRRAGVCYALVSHESLSRGRTPERCIDGIIVDESHRFRTPGSKRHAVLARMAAHVPLLLLSATPLQNATRDLASQLALFLGSRAFRMDPRELASYVVCGPARDDPRLPTLSAPQWVRPAADDDAVLRAILALPSPPRPVDGGDGGVLRTISLVRAWASSRAALSATLRRRGQVAAAIEQSAAEGLLPSRRELKPWLASDAEVQLGFTPLLVEGTLGTDAAHTLLRAVLAERAGLDRVRLSMRDGNDPDAARVEALEQIRARHPEARVLAFSELASTVRAYWAGMRHHAHVGMLTANDARIASGRLSRAELLARFAPRAQGAREPLPRERVTLLLATDLLSEGVNLQDASVVVHLDLPWNPARLAQRVGRVRRPGGPAMIHTYLLAPPARSELLLDVEARLRRKLARAERTIGHTLAVVPQLGARSERHDDARDDKSDLASAAARGALAERLAGWRCAGVKGRAHGRPIIAAATAARHGWLAALADGRLLASLDAAEPDTLGSVPAAAMLAEGPARPLREGEADAALAAVDQWLATERVAQDCGLLDGREPLVAAFERRMARIVRSVPRHERAAVTELAHRLRDALRIPASLGVERELSALLAGAAAESGLGFLRDALAVVGGVHGSTASREHWARMVALVLFGPAEPRA